MYVIYKNHTLFLAQGIYLENPRKSSSTIQLYFADSTTVLGVPGATPEYTLHMVALYVLYSCFSPGGRNFVSRILSSTRRRIIVFCTSTRWSDHRAWHIQIADHSSLLWSITCSWLRTVLESAWSDIYLFHDDETIVGDYTGDEKYPIWKAVLVC